MYIREIKSCIRGDHQSHVSARIGPRACLHACNAAQRKHAMPRRPLHRVTRTQRARPCFVSIAQIMPDRERTSHGWKRLTCKLRARSGRLRQRREPATRDRPAAPMHLDHRAISTTHNRFRRHRYARSACNRRVGLACNDSNPHGGMTRFSLWTAGWLAERFDAAPRLYVAIVSIQRAR